MSLEHAILGFLNYKPFSGYDLKKAFDTSVRHFWPADQSQIYRTLSRLTANGWVEMERIAQTERPDRKVYQITSAGQAELRRWLNGPFPPQETRMGALIQVFFAGQLSDAEILTKFQEIAGALRSQLAQYNQMPAQISEYARTMSSPREEFFWMLTLDLGLAMMQTQLEWAERVIRRIQNGEYPARATARAQPRGRASRKKSRPTAKKSSPRSKR